MTSRGLSSHADQPQLAVVVLSLDCEPWLAEAVASVLAQRPRAEVVVVNSGAGDARAALGAGLTDVPVVERPERLMPGAVRNLGVAATRAPYVAFLAADCLAEPGWVANRVAAHAGGARAVASLLTNAYPSSRSAAAAALLLHHRRMAHTPAQMLLRLGVSVDRALLDELGPYREDLRTGEDSEMNDRIRAAGVEIALAAGVLTAHRNPRRPAALLREQFWRGVRRARAGAALDQRPTGLPAGMLIDAVRALRYTTYCPDPVERGRLRYGWPLIVPAAVAYSAGTTAAIWRDRR